MLSNIYKFVHSPIMPVASNPSIGFELECRGIPLDNSNPKVLALGSDYKVSACLKGKPFIIPGIPKNSNWSITAETISDSIKRIATEAIIAGPDGKGVKFSSNPEIGLTIGNEIVAALKKWSPHKGLQVTIQGFEEFGPWIVQKPEKPSLYLGWGMHVTAPFPLSAIPSIVAQPSVLLERRSAKAYPELSKEILPWTGSKKKGTAKYLSDPDVLGFLTIILGYVKAAEAGDPIRGPKHSISIMPRTDFRTIYASTGVKAVIEDWTKKVSGNPEVKEYYGFNVVDLKSFVLAAGIDCGFRPSGETDFPASLVLGWENWHSAQNEKYHLPIKDWLVNLQEKRDDVDLVSMYDKKYQAGQIGGLGQKMEKTIDGKKLLPIFEFRDLTAVFTEEVPKRLQECEKAIRKAHKDVV